MSRLLLHTYVRKYGHNGCKGCGNDGGMGSSDFPQIAWIGGGSQFLRYYGLMGFKLYLSTLIYQVKYHPIPGFQYCWDGNRREGLGSNPPSSELFSESFGQCALASLRLGVSGYRLRFLSDGDVSYETKCWEAGLQRRFPRLSVRYIHIYIFIYIYKLIII